MGSIYKRGKNYYVDIHSDGKRIRKKVGPSKQLAELVLKDMEVKVAKRKFDFSKADGFISDLFESFIEYSKINPVPTTRKRYWQVIRNFQIFLALKYLNKTKISQLNLELFE